jgi:hypothetical protein
MARSVPKAVIRLLAFAELDYSGCGIEADNVVSVAEQRRNDFERSRVVPSRQRS